MGILRVKELSYKDILKDINMDIKEQQFITISGSNMCGKTTLIKLLSGMLSSKNNIFLESKSIEKMSRNNFYKSVSFVIPSQEEIFIFPTVEKELLFILDNLGIRPSVKMSRYKEMLELFDLKEITQSDPNTLDEKTQTKLRLAIAVMTKPKVLLLDDICFMMNKKETDDIIKKLKALQKAYKITIIMTTSNLRETISSDYLYIINGGKIILEDKPLKILKKDNELNRLGLSVPFMIDLCVKLEDYDLINKVVLDMDLLMSVLWK